MAGGYQVSRCGDCTHVFVSGGLVPDELDKAYTRDYYRAGTTADAAGYRDYLDDAEARMRGFKTRLSQIEQWAPVAKGRLLDFGAAVGLFVKVASDAGWEAVGYERSAWAAQYGREQFGVDILVGTGSEVPEFESRFDVVTMWDVIEHLERPRDVFDLVTKWLKPGGLLALNTVNSSSIGARIAGRHWRHLAPPHHLQYFSRKSLRRLLQEYGLETLWLKNSGVIVMADRRRQQLPGFIAAVERIGTHWRFSRLATLLNLRDEIEAGARRR